MSMHNEYFDTVQLIERLHRNFLDVLKAELETLNLQDINNIQSLILYNIGSDNLTIGELTMRGYYLGSNVSYNVKKMVENGYLLQERSQHDRRSFRVRLSEKGLELKEKIRQMFERHAQELNHFELNQDAIESVNERLKLLDRFWAVRANPSGKPF